MGIRHTVAAQSPLSVASCPGIPIALIDNGERNHSRCGATCISTTAATALAQSRSGGPEEDGEHNMVERSQNGTLCAKTSFHGAQSVLEMSSGLKLPHSNLSGIMQDMKKFRPVMKSLCRDLSDEQVGAGPAWSRGKAPGGY
jgi:hypothetical protein